MAQCAPGGESETEKHENKHLKKNQIFQNLGMIIYGEKASLLSPYINLEKLLHSNRAAHNDFSSAPRPNPG